jgi:long-chain fatty acid transport protein
MTSKSMIRGALAVLLATSAFTAAHAGGFNRGEADTDILFEDGVFMVRGGVTYVNPQRKFDTIDGNSSSDGVYSNEYAIPSFALKVGLSDNFSCALTYTQAFGADQDYGSQAQAADQAASAVGNYTTHKDFTANEVGSTCDVSMGAGPGRIHFIGGIFGQDFSYTEKTYAGTLSLNDGMQPGYRLGVAYDIEEYAMRAELLYTSQVDHNADGGFTLTPYGSLLATSGATTALAGSELDSYGSGSLPQSVKLSLQSGIAPGWLAYGSVKWTDWSVLQTLDYTITGFGDQHLNFFWRDGWTVQAGIAHAFTDKIAGTVNLTWDRGVGTGADIMTDVWTLAAGTAIKAELGEFRLGAAVSYLTSGSQTTSGGADYDATANGDWAFAVSGSYRISF